MNKKFRPGAIMIALVSTIIGIGITPILSLQSTYAAIENGAQLASTSSKKSDSFVSTGEIEQRKAPPAITGDNVYLAWWDNKTGSNEVFFRASTDKGQTFGDKINLSNTPNADSTKVEIDSDSNSVVVTWWETNQTGSTPVMRISTDNGKTFGPVLNLSANGTIGSSGG
jgi:peptidoglycan hydrolase-like protein with peptidoglycan-binding domain